MNCGSFGCDGNTDITMTNQQWGILAFKKTIVTTFLGLRHIYTVRWTNLRLLPLPIVKISEEATDYFSTWVCHIFFILRVGPNAS